MPLTVEVYAYLPSFRQPQFVVQPPICLLQIPSLRSCVGPAYVGFEAGLGIGHSFHASFKTVLQVEFHQLLIHQYSLYHFTSYNS